MQPEHCAGCGARLTNERWVDAESDRVYCAPECRRLEERVEALRDRYPVARTPDAIPARPAATQVRG